MTADEIFESFTITEEKAAELISNHIFEAYNEFGDNDILVAGQILRLADLQDATALVTATNVLVIQRILKASGGARNHQCTFSFRMGVK